MAAAIITATRLRELLNYNPATGVFTNRIKRSRKTVAGAPAGGERDGYVAIRLDGVLYQAHRLAVLYVTGQWPEFEVDHRNGVRCDNRWDNLRDKTHQTNLQNLRVARADNALGVLGVSMSRGKFKAQIKVEGKNKCLGRFDTLDEAEQAYLNAKRAGHEGCTI